MQTCFVRHVQIIDIHNLNSNEDVIIMLQYYQHHQWFNDHWILWIVDQEG